MRSLIQARAHLLILISGVTGLEGGVTVRYVCFISFDFMVSGAFIQLSGLEVFS